MFICLKHIHLTFDLLAFIFLFMLCFLYFQIHLACNLLQFTSVYNKISDKNKKRYGFKLMYRSGIAKWIQLVILNSLAKRQNSSVCRKLHACSYLLQVYVDVCVNIQACIYSHRYSHIYTRINMFVYRCVCVSQPMQWWYVLNI